MAFTLVILALLFQLARTHEGSHDALCRLCGATLFHTRDTVPGVVLTGARVADVRPEPLLGAEGAQHVLSRVKGGELRVGVFSSAAQRGGGSAVALGAETPPVFPGFTQRVATCSNCRAAVGWRLDAAGTGGQSADAAVTPPLSVASSPSASPSPPPLSPVERLISDGAVLYTSAADALTRLAPLVHGPCLPLTLGWWTYSVCPGRRVEQFHVPSTPWSPGTQEPNPASSSPWSLGTHEPTRRFERADLPSGSDARAFFMSQHFSGGQHCDETGKGRSSEVQYHCCGDPVLSGPSLSQPHIASVVEGPLCHYTFRVCVPTLCAAHERVTAQMRGEVGVGVAGDVQPVPGEDAPTASATSGAAEGGAGEGGSDVEVPSAQPSPQPQPIVPVSSFVRSTEFDAARPPRSFFVAAFDKLLLTSSEEYDSLASGKLGVDLGGVRIM